MKKIFKNIAALALALVLTASLSAAAWADGDGTDTGAAAAASAATVTITDLADNETVVAYKVVSYADDYHSYNYAFVLHKVDNDDNALSGAKFSIYSDKECKSILKFTAGEDPEDVVYYPDESGNITEIEANPSFTIIGLGSGVYYVKEVSAPKGYFEPTGAFELELHSYEPLGAATTADHENLSDTYCSFASVETKDAELVPILKQTVALRQYDVTLKNATTPVLPTTGGAGTVMFTVGGVAVMVLAAVLFLRRKREE